VNVDIFAYGDTVFSTAPDAEGMLHRTLREAAKETGLGLRYLPPERYPRSDHHSMIAAGVDTVGIALIEAAEVDEISALEPESLVPGTGSRTLSIIHTLRDTVSEVRVAEMVRAIPVVERLVRSIDRE
jgi:hypothetical protein